MHRQNRRDGGLLLKAPSRHCLTECRFISPQGCISTRFHSPSERRLFRMFDGYFCAIQTETILRTTTQHQRTSMQRMTSKRLQQALQFLSPGFCLNTVVVCRNYSNIKTTEESMREREREREREEARETSSFTQANKSPYCCY